jgi:hypothetical protein
VFRLNYWRGRKVGERAQAQFLSACTLSSSMDILEVCFQGPSWYWNSLCAWISLIQVLQQSGSPSKLPNVLDMQRYFDDIVSATNCTNAQDRLGCLRAVPYAQLIQAVNREPNYYSYPSLKLAFQPMVDGRLIPRDPLQILQSGEYARVSTRIPQSGPFLRFNRFLLSQAIAKTRGRESTSWLPSKQ